MWLVIALMFAAPKPPRPVVVVTEGFERARLAVDAVTAIERIGLRAEPLDLSAFLEVAPKSCPGHVECLCGAPALHGEDNVLVLRLSQLSGPLRAIDVRRIDCRDASLRGRLSVALDEKELGGWVDRFVPKMLLVAR